MAKDPQTSIVIKGDPQADYEMVVNIIDMAARFNLARYFFRILLDNLLFK